MSTAPLPTSPPPELRPEHLEHLRSSGLTDATLRAAGICSLDERAALHEAARVASDASRPAA